MKKTTLGLTTLAFVSASSMAFAQTAFDGANTATNMNEDLRDEIEQDFEEDTNDFGNEGRPIGFSGSVALRGTASSGNTDNTDLSIGTDLVYFDGKNGYSLELNYVYGETDGTKTDDTLFFDAQYTRDFSPALYGFVKLQGTNDSFSSYESDYFFGFGAGYRVVDTPTTKWTVQGGPGYRVATLSDIASTDFKEGALAVSSDLSYKISDTVFLTNATDIVTSSSDTVVLNELGVTMPVNDSLAVKTSIQTEYHTDPEAGYKSTDNNFGVSLIYSF